MLEFRASKLLSPWKYSISLHSAPFQFYDTCCGYITLFIRVKTPPPSPSHRPFKWGETRYPAMSESTSPLCLQSVQGDSFSLMLWLQQYFVEQKNGVRGCYRGGSCWNTVFLHSTVHTRASLRTLHKINPSIDSLESGSGTCQTNSISRNIFVPFSLPVFLGWRDRAVNIRRPFRLKNGDWAEWVTEDGILSTVSSPLENVK